MKTKLFTEDTESYTIAANQIANEFDRAIREVFSKYADYHYARELEVIAISSVSMAAVQAVMNFQKRVSDNLKAEMAANLIDPNLADKVRDYCKDNFNKLPSFNTIHSSLIQAIKALRQLTGMGLRESKDWVEKNMPEFHPDNYK